jgi:hypothetical protein
MKGWRDADDIEKYAEIFSFFAQPLIAMRKMKAPVRKMTEKRVTSPILRVQNHKIFFANKIAVDFFITAGLLPDTRF